MYVVRPSMASIISEPIAWIPFKFWLLLPLDHMPDPCLIFFFFDFFLLIFSFSLAWDPMGAKISKRYSYKSQPNAFELFLNFLPNGPHKTAFGIFEISKIEILTFFFYLQTNLGKFLLSHVYFNCTCTCIEQFSFGSNWTFLAVTELHFGKYPPNGAKKLRLTKVTTWQVQRNLPTDKSHTV